MQHRQITRASAYSLAGDALSPFERILVARSVDLPDSEMDAEETRVPYRANETADKRAGLSLPWAVLLILCAIVIMSASLMTKADRAGRLQEEVELLKNKYVAAEEERRLLENEFIKASDSSYISYYAAQNLGMKRAVHEETIQVTAMSTRPQIYNANNRFGGLSTGNNTPFR